jgi:ribosomal protein L40E
MIVCPNCKHENPEGATSCEACYTALPATKACPTCGASVQLDATFCGQCGQNLTSADPKTPSAVPVSAEAVSSGLPPTVLTGRDAISSPPAIPPTAPAAPPQLPDPVFEVLEIETPAPTASTVPPTVAAVPTPPDLVTEPPSTPAQPLIPDPAPVIATQIQPTAYSLLHLQTNTSIEIPLHLSVIHIGKPNEQSPPDIDVSGFPSAEVVSRIHANLRIEGQDYYIEDVGSANGTYINHNVLAKGNRHLLRPGDRIGLGKGDLVTFIFQ